MLNAPIPANDRARLQELRSYGILDSGDEQEFDDISYLVRDIADTPIGIISLVDENRQWFKSCIGLEARETPRNISFCGHTILQRTPLIIEDTLLDERFRDNPLVVEAPHIRFYAGFPLISRNGMALGSLCAVDHRPRQPTAQQITALERLARLVEQLMELRRESRMLQDSEQARLQEGLRRQTPQRENSTALIVGKEQILSMVELLINLNNQACFALLRMELKELRRIASTLGDPVADTLRHELQQRLSRLVPENTSCGELSDHEWLVLLPFESSEDRVSALAAQIIEQLQKPVTIAGQWLGSPVAIGIALFRDNYASAETLLADAAMALRDAARRPGSHYRFIDLASRIQAQADLQLEGQLREGLHRGQLLTHFQPLVELSSGQVLGVEALARWQSSDGQVLPPGDFLPAAEQANLLGELDLQMLSQAIRGSRHLAASLNHDRPMVLSVNLSAAVLDSPAAIARLLAIVDRESLPRQWHLQLELVEHALQGPPAELADTLDQLHRRGVRLAIDDFGTGYSSLSRLNSYPFHTLKVDMSFVRLLDAPEQASNRILEGIQTLAEALGLHTTAEGVETEQQRRWLERQGFHWGQGYLFAKPMDLEQTARYLAGAPQLVLEAANNFRRSD
jgi:EAL domain-containing protein (putative c-di-GMP-specific phosphodiesterase class I)/GAF domain-containing protein